MEKTKDTVASASFSYLRPAPQFSRSERRVQSYIGHCISVYLNEYVSGTSVGLRGWLLHWKSSSKTLERRTTTSSAPGFPAARLLLLLQRASWKRRRAVCRA